jgi:fructose-1,6-bisphosphatase I
MPTFQTLEDFLEKEQRDDETGRAVLQLCRQLRSALIKISTVVACGPLAGDLAAAQGSNPDGDVQKKLDIVAHDYVIETLRESPAAWVLSEEHDTPIELDRTRPLAIAIDPLDGSSNIETNAPIGTIFSILPNPGPDATRRSARSSASSRTPDRMRRPRRCSCSLVPSSLQRATASTGHIPSSC